GVEPRHHPLPQPEPVGTDHLAPADRRIVRQLRLLDDLDVPAVEVVLLVDQLLDVLAICHRLLQVASRTDTRWHNAWNDRVFLARPVVRVVVYIPCAHCAWPTRSYQGRLKTVRRDTARVAPDQITARRGIDTGTKEFGTGEESTPHDEQNPDMGSQ